MKHPFLALILSLGISVSVSMAQAGVPTPAYADQTTNTVIQKPCWRQLTSVDWIDFKRISAFKAQTNSDNQQTVRVYIAGYRENSYDSYPGHDFITVAMNNGMSAEQYIAARIKEIQQCN
jgi:hypothetical protein